MWPFLSKRAKDYLEREDVLAAATDSLQSPKSFAKFLTRFSEMDAERVIVAYREQKVGLRRDPIEDAPEYGDIFREVAELVSQRYPERHMGQCHAEWRLKKSLLKERGVSWLSPSDLNPFNRYD